MNKYRLQGFMNEAAPNTDSRLSIRSRSQRLASQQKKIHTESSDEEEVTLRALTKSKSQELEGIPEEPHTESSDEEEVNWRASLKPLKLPTIQEESHAESSEESSFDSSEDESITKALSFIETLWSFPEYQLPRFKEIKKQLDSLLTSKIQLYVSDWLLKEDYKAYSKLYKALENQFNEVVSPVLALLDNTDMNLSEREQKVGKINKKLHTISDFLIAPKTTPTIFNIWINKEESGLPFKKDLEKINTDLFEILQNLNKKRSVKHENQPEMYYQKRFFKALHNCSRDVKHCHSLSNLLMKHRSLRNFFTEERLQRLTEMAEKMGKIVKSDDNVWMHEFDRNDPTYAEVAEQEAELINLFGFIGKDGRKFNGMTKVPPLPLCDDSEKEAAFQKRTCRK